MLPKWLIVVKRHTLHSAEWAYCTEMVENTAGNCLQKLYKCSAIGKVVFKITNAGVRTGP